ncbi:LysR family transcriptional regulator [Ralstonia sp. A12]|uniref:LysR family transcriptional regulator n=1 Tax=Ralstonia sp. A12 TaxID=1217052 RepID=UPI0005759FDB|nr:LysR family transcriptional regulator [Ralstonia sp. A12]KHK54890.1 LysR family transcriptional regulator [Ralstonia sp. A12]
MEDLNDLVLFASVVTHGSFSGAARALGIPKSRVSRRVADLEARLGVRLLQRSTRAVHVTDVGSAFYTHCETMTQAANAAFEVAEHAGEKPSGRLRVSCPVGVASLFMAPVVPKFLRAHPDVRLELDVTSRRVDVISEGYDVALRVRSTLDDSNLVVRTFGVSNQVLVASPEFVAEHGPFETPESLQGVRGLWLGAVSSERSRWRLAGPEGAVDIECQPVLATDDLRLLGLSAIAGVGVAQLPTNQCAEALHDGRLVQLLPQYKLQMHQFHAVFPSRRGLVPAVRAFIEFLAVELPPITARVQTGCYEERGPSADR